MTSYSQKRTLAIDIHEPIGRDGLSLLSSQETLEEVKIALRSADESRTAYLLQNDILPILVALFKKRKLTEFDAKFLLARAQEDAWHRYSVDEVLQLLADDLPRLRVLRMDSSDISAKVELNFHDELIASSVNIMECIRLEGFTDSRISDMESLSISRADFSKCLRNRACKVSPSEANLLLSYLDQDDEFILTIPPPSLNPYTLGGPDIPSIYWKLLQVRVDAFVYCDTHRDIDYSIRSMVRAAFPDKGKYNLLPYERSQKL